MDTTEILKSIEKLAEKLGITAEKLFGYYVKNAKLQRFYYPIEMVFTIVLLIIGILLMNHFFITDDSTPFQITWFVLGAALGLFGLIGVIVGFGSFRTFINAFANPEYEAIENLFGSLFND